MYKKEWLFELAQSSNLSKIAELDTIKSRNLTLTLNRAGEFTFNLALEDTISTSISEVETCILIKRRNFNSGLFEVVWSGPVWTMELTTPNTFSVRCVGWLQTLEKRLLAEDTEFNSVDAGTIIRTVIENSIEPGIPNYITPGEILPTSTRTREYKAYESILSIIQGLSEIENGLDLFVQPDTRVLNISNFYGGNNPNLVFEYGNNIGGVTRSSDTSRLCNRIIVAGGPSTTPQIANDVDSQSRYGLFEEYVSLTDVRSNTILQAYGAAELAIRAWPLRIYSFTTRQAGFGSVTPRIFEDFSVGDIGYLSVSKGPLQLSRQAVRVFGASVSFDDNGNEQSISIQTTAQ